VEAIEIHGDVVGRCDEWVSFRFVRVMVGQSVPEVCDGGVAVIGETERVKSVRLQIRLLNRMRNAAMVLETQSMVVPGCVRR